MSLLRPTLKASTRDAIPDATALYMITDAVAHRRLLIHGQLENKRGRTCAIGAFFHDNPTSVIHTALIDEVTAYNDSIPPTRSMKERRNRVLRWLRWRLRTLASSRK